MSGFKKIFFLVLIISLGLLASSDAYKVSDLEFKDIFKRGSVELSLRGAGLKKFSSIRIAAAAFYLKKDVDTKDALADVSKAIEIIFLQNIPAIELQRAMTKGIRLNVSQKEFNKLLPSNDILNAYYPSVKKMDRMQITYVAGKGTILEVNGVVKGAIPGADFGRAFFSIWLGQRPVDPFFKKILLGKVKQRNVD